MKIINSTSQFNNTAFQKRFAAKANILSKDDKVQRVNIYHLNKKKDVKYLEQALKQNEWKGSYYLDSATICFDDDYKDVKYYIMEDTEHNVLCFSIFHDKDKIYNALSCIETAPGQSCYSTEKRGLKYIGETMLAFLAEKTKKQGKDLRALSVAKRPKTQQFYFKQCGFSKDGERNAKLEYSQLDDFINKNANHTKGGVKISFVA